MALAETILPFGMREVLLTPINTDGTLGTGVKLPAARTLSFSEAEDFEELRGDDRLITVRGTGPNVNWDLEGGGISLEAWNVLSGGTVVEEGTSTDGDLRKRFSKGAYDTRPKFKAEGRAISDSGGDFHAVLYLCRATGDLSGEMSDGSFWLTSASGQAFPDENNGDVLYDFIQYEVETAIT